MSAGTWPPADKLDEDGIYYWLHSERSMSPSIAQWIGNKWALICEDTPISPQELRKRGWELLGEAIPLPSKYLDP